MFRFILGLSILFSCGNIYADHLPFSKKKHILKLINSPDKPNRFFWGHLNKKTQEKQNSEGFPRLKESDFLVEKIHKKKLPSDFSYLAFCENTIVMTFSPSEDNDNWVYMLYSAKSMQEFIQIFNQSLIEDRSLFVSKKTDVIELKDTFGKEKSAWAMAVNNKSTVVGLSYGKKNYPDFFIWKPNSGMLKIELPKEVLIAVPDSLNDKDEVVGYCLLEEKDLFLAAFHWTAKSGMTFLTKHKLAVNHFKDYCDTFNSLLESIKINNQGTVVGHYWDSSMHRTTLFLWDNKKMVTTDLVNDPIKTDQALVDFNQSGDVLFRDLNLGEETNFCIWSPEHGVRSVEMPPLKEILSEELESNNIHPSSHLDDFDEDFDLSCFGFNDRREILFSADYYNFHTNEYCSQDFLNKPGSPVILLPKKYGKKLNKLLFVFPFAYDNNGRLFLLGKEDFYGPVSLFLASPKKGN
ncbi:MAG: hypothetical protein Tsb0021_08690 [Chlamydiales bacterium]